MARASRYIAIAAAISAGAVAALAPDLVRSRVQRATLRACAERSTLRCEVSGVSLAADGLLLHRVTLRDPSGAPVVLVQRVGARWSWLRLLLRRTQGVTVRVGEVRVQARGELATLRGYLRARDPREGARSGRLRIDGVTVERFSVGLSLTQRDAPAVGLSVRDGRGEWSRGAPFIARWSDGALSLGGVEAQSGRCVAHVDRWRREVECEGASGTAPLDALTRAVSAVQTLTASAGRGASAPVEGADPDAEGAAESPRTALRLRDATVRVTRAGEELVNLHPTHVALTLRGARVDEVRVDVGARDDPNAALSALLHRPGDSPWRLALRAVDLPLGRVAPWIPAIPWHGVERGTLRAQVRLSPGDRAGVYQLEGDLGVQDFGLLHPGLAREAVDGLSASLEGRVLIDLDARRVSTPALNASVNGIRFALRGSAQRTPRWTAVDASLELPQLDCDTPRTALPANVVGPLRGFAFSGTLAARASVRLDTRRLSETALDFHVDDRCLIAQSGFEVDLRRFSRPFVQRVHEPGGAERAFITGPGAPAWVPLPSISPFVIGAVVTREDGGFFRHHGFSPDEVRGALVRNISLGRFAFGASTISMQLVKNVFLAREKTLVRKLQEVALTWWMERSLDKNSILELYLNVVEFGPGIYGIGPASRFFFGVEPRDLTVLQAAYLATLLPAPVPRFAIFQRGVLSLDTLARLRGIARAMVASRLVDPSAAAQARAEGVAFRPRATPPPGAATWSVDPATTDEAAQVMVERAAVRISAQPEAPPEGSGGSEPPEPRGDDAARDEPAAAE